MDRTGSEVWTELAQRCEPGFFISLTNRVHVPGVCTSHTHTHFLAPPAEGPRSRDATSVTGRLGDTATRGWGRGRTRSTRLWSRELRGQRHVS